MAILLTGEYKLLGEVVLQDSTYDNKLRLYGRQTGVNPEEGTTSYQRKLVFYRSDGSVSIDSGSANINASKKTFTNVTFSKGETTLIEEERTLSHNEDGTIDSFDLTFTWTASYGGSGTKTVQVSLLDFPQLSTESVEKNKAVVKVSKFANKGQTISNVGWRITTDSTKTQYDRVDGTTSHTFTNLLPNTTYYVRTYVETNYYSIHSKWISFTTKKSNVVRLNVNGTWKEAIPYVNVNGTWKEATPYINVNGTWKETN